MSRPPRPPLQCLAKAICLAPENAGVAIAIAFRWESREGTSGLRPDVRCAARCSSTPASLPLSLPRFAPLLWSACLIRLLPAA